ncbi:uncharacterized protein N7458_003155 [Penicillium daleae]|uniref:Uncharacterized protein n=1 Tax=Penicillium daleae TaxID=63821 RepID=A0AAD6G7U7_9EURO|nr:uncharacterized protein N7458_003155 [Penicillium daleae]KAJ5461603.1 hypothetical protein N7458_003155 [Penicillium daleae]
MAEVIGVVSGAVTFATLVVQDQFRDTSNDLQWFLGEAEVFETIMADIEVDISREPIASSLQGSQHALQSFYFYKRAAEDMDALCKDLMQDVNSSNRLRKSYKAAKVVFRRGRIEKHRSRLQNVIRLLMLSQQCYTRYLYTQDVEPRTGANICRALIQVQPDLIAERIRERDVISSTTETIKAHSKSHNCCLDITGMPAGTSKRITKSDARKSSSDFTFRTYTEIPWNAGVDRLVREGKIEILRNLFALGQLSALHRNGNHTLLYDAVCRDRNEKVVEFLLNEGADPFIEDYPRRLTPLRLALWIRKLAPSNEDYPLLPYLRVLLKNSKDLVYGSPQDVVNGVLSEFYGSDEEFRFLQ